MADQFTVEAIGWVRCGRDTPIDDQWDSFPATIELDTMKFDAAALLGLADFSHAEIIYLFHLVEDAEVETGARHPRGRTDWPRVGVFAQRGKGRPNRLGATICRIVSVEGTRLKVQGLDAVDGAPVLDIKPVMSGFLPRGDVKEPAWAKELMQRYW
jgi:tRNA (Thr-GGU) A37 N-methylase